MAEGSQTFFRFPDRFVDAAEGQWQVMVVLALNTGLRRGELLAVRWEDVDIVTGRLLVRRSVWRNLVGTPKSGRSREVPLNDRALHALRAHRHLRGPLVFCKDDGRQAELPVAAERQVGHVVIGYGVRIFSSRRL